MGAGGAAAAVVHVWIMVVVTTIKKGNSLSLFLYLVIVNQSSKQVSRCPDAMQVAGEEDVLMYASGRRRRKLC